MRAHACRHSGKVFPSYPDLRQHLHSHLLPSNVCPTCDRGFTRRDHLLRHSSCCTPKPFVCGVCRSSFTRERDLDRHTNTVRCGAPPQPEPAPKRQKVTHLREDPLTPPPPVEHAANDELSSTLRDFVHENWTSVRTHMVHGPVQMRYNHRLTTTDLRVLNEPLGKTI